MKVIPQTHHSHYIRYLRFYFYFAMSVPDEGYSTNTLFALHYISSFLFLFYYELTWWRLFHKHVIHTTLAIFVSIFIVIWAYLMKVIPQTRHSHYIRYLRFYFYFTMSVTAEGYSINTSFALHYISYFLFLFYYERTCWRLFHKHIIRTTLAIFVSIFILLWTYLMKIITQTRYSHYIIYLRFYFYFTMSVPDEGYSTNTSFAHYISYLRSYFYSTMSVPYESYSTNTSFALHYISSFLFLFYYERTWCRLFHKHVIRTTLYILFSIFILLWAYLMKVIPQTRYSHYIIYLRFYFYLIMSVPDEGYSKNISFTLH